MRTKHGIHARNSPNAFFVQLTQGTNLISNIPNNIVASEKPIAPMIKHALDSNSKVVEVSQAAKDEWLELLLTGADTMLDSLDCTLGYPAGAAAYFQYIAEWRETSDFEGIQFRQ